MYAKYLFMLNSYFRLLLNIISLDGINKCHEMSTRSANSNDIYSAYLASYDFTRPRYVAVYDCYEYVHLIFNN